MGFLWAHHGSANGRNAHDTVKEAGNPTRHGTKKTHFVTRTSESRTSQLGEEDFGGIKKRTGLVVAERETIYRHR